MISTRTFSPTDIPSVTKVVAESLGETYPPSLYLTIHNLWSEGFIVLIEDGRMIGFVAAVPSGDRIARILMLAVTTGRRRLSYGTRLMNELYSSCGRRGMDTIVLEVRKSNKSALAFYERHGFSVCGDIKRFYSNGEDAYKMMKVIQT